MGAPRCLVILPERLTADDGAGWGSWVRAFGTLTRDELHGFVIEGFLEPLRRDAEDEGTPRIALRILDHPFLVPQPGTGFCSAQVAQAVGWEPRGWVDLCAFTSAPYNHALVGRVAAELAERYRGVIEFRAFPSRADDEPPPPPARTVEETIRRSDEKERRWFRTMPGTAYELLDLEGFVHAHVVDHRFMRAWMKDPDFYIE